MGEKRTIEFKYTKDPDYRRIYVTGFWGGINPVGDLEIELFRDTQLTPESLVQVVTDDTTTVLEEKRIPEVDPQKLKLERILQVGVTIPMRVVPSLITWLQDKINQYNQFTVQSQAQKQDQTI